MCVQYIIGKTVRVNRRKVNRQRQKIKKKGKHNHGERLRETIPKRLRTARLTLNRTKRPLSSDLGYEIRVSQNTASKHRTLDRAWLQRSTRRRLCAQAGLSHTCSNSCQTIVAVKTACVQKTLSNNASSQRYLSQNGLSRNSYELKGASEKVPNTNESNNKYIQRANPRQNKFLKQESNRRCAQTQKRMHRNMCQITLAPSTINKQYFGGVKMEGVTLSGSTLTGV